MEKIELIRKLKEDKVVAVIRMDKGAVEDVIHAIIKGGISFIEITFTMNDAISLLDKISKDYESQQVAIGAGTILDAISARIAILHGAQFIVAPTFDKDTAEICNLYRIPYIPGIHNPNDIREALQAGCDILKIFPASTLQPFIIKEFKGPFPQADFMISGKVDRKNASEWIQAGASAVCLGSVLTNKETQGMEAVSEESGTFVNMLQGIGK